MPESSAGLNAPQEKVLVRGVSRRRGVDEDGEGVFRIHASPQLWLRPKRRATGDVRRRTAPRSAARPAKTSIAPNSSPGWPGRSRSTLEGLHRLVKRAGCSIKRSGTFRDIGMPWRNPRQGNVCYTECAVEKMESPVVQIPPDPLSAGGKSIPGCAGEGQ